MDDLTKTTALLKDQFAAATDADPLGALRHVATVTTAVKEIRMDAVRAAVPHHSWGEIGEALGVSKQAAHKKFAKEWVKQLKGEIKAESTKIKTAHKRKDLGSIDESVAKIHEVADEFKRASRKK